MMPMSLNELTTVIRPRGQESLVAENTGVRSGQLVHHEPDLIIQGSGDSTFTQAVKAAKIMGVCKWPGAQSTPLRGGET